MPEKAKVPAIRFKGFTDAWEQRKLSELGKTQSGIGFSESEQGGSDGFPFFKVSDMNNLGNEHEMKIANNYVSFEQLQRRNWKPIEGVPCVIFAKVGAAIMLDRKRIVRVPFLIDNNTMAYIFDGSWDVDFGKTLFETIPLPRYAQVGALPSYNGSDIEDIEVCVPTNEEQTKIAELFVSLDNLITLHQRKLLKLKNVKKAMLEKMFPKNGSTVPEIRFAGFTDAWEQRKLGEVTKSYSGGTPSVGKMEYYNGQIPFIRSAEINNNTTELFLSETGLTNSSAKMVRVGDILYALYGATSGEVGIAQIQGAINQAILAIKPDDGYDSQFLMYWLRGQKQRIIDKYLQGGQGNLSGSLVKDLLVMIPNYDEQERIGAYFQQLDHLITLHQRKYEKLQNLKKACLQKMFV